MIAEIYIYKDGRSECNGDWLLVTNTLTFKIHTVFESQPNRHFKIYTINGLQKLEKKKLRKVRSVPHLHTPSPMSTTVTFGRTAVSVLTLYEN